MLPASPLLVRAFLLGKLWEAMQAWPLAASARVQAAICCELPNLNYHEFLHDWRRSWHYHMTLVLLIHKSRNYNAFK
jgi:hypothetical protein